ncbi:MAG: glycosyltransferase family 1 protein [Rhodobacteraceae bacterium]|nr:glycosyltransferase family 1 protein [Paracoccaceae bacterium]
MEFGVVPMPKRNVLVFSQRAIQTNASRCSGYEFEDVICDLEGGDLAVARPSKGYDRKFRARRWMSKRSGLFRHLPSCADHGPLQEDYDLFVCGIQKPLELLTLDAIPNWRERSRLAVCVIEELWLTTIDQFRPLVKTLSEFDLITCAFAGSCKELSRLTGRPVIHLPGAAGMLRFADDRPSNERPVDVYYMGRRREDLHQELLKLLGARDEFYIYDTGVGAPVVTDHVAHRDYFASLVQRSKIFVVDYAKIGHVDQIRGEIAWGPRHVEGMAGGAAQVGYAPDTADYLSHFDWPEAVSRLPEDPAEAAREIAALLDAPDEIDRRRAINLRNALMRHDWLHRWALILDHFGLSETPTMKTRRQCLRDRSPASATAGASRMTG